jgi:hypothetical protein
VVAVSVFALLRLDVVRRERAARAREREEEVAR